MKRILHTTFDKDSRKKCNYIYEVTASTKSEKGINVFELRGGKKYVNRKYKILEKLKLMVYKKYLKNFRHLTNMLHDMTEFSIWNIHI